MTIHICHSVKKNCWNPYDSYGEICIGCGCCSDDPLERAKARLAVSEDHLQRDIDFDQWSDDPKWRAVQEKNRKANIRYNRRRVYYYKKRVNNLETSNLNTNSGVNVVLCKDCSKRNKRGCPLVCEDSWYTKTPPDDFFCAFGERG